MVDGFIVACMKKVFIIPVLVFGCLVSVQPNSLFAAAPSDGMVLYYTFDNTLNDSSTTGNNAISIGAAFGTDRFGNPNSALSVTSTTGVTSQSNVGISGNSSRTISLWLNPTVDPANWPKGALVGWGQGGWEVGVSRLSAINYLPSYAANGDVNIQFNGFYADANVRTDPWSFAGNWYQLVVVYAGSTSNAKIYLNGVLQTDLFHNGLQDPFAVTTLNTIDTTFRVNVEASGSGTSGIDGFYDDIRIYDRALSSTEVTDLYNAERPVYEVTLTLKSSTNITDWTPVLTNIVETYNPQEFYKNDISVRIKAP